MIHALLLAAATATLTPAQVDSMMDKAEKAFSAYVFPDVGRKAAAMLKAQTKRYETITDPKAFKEAVNADLYAATHDKHVRVWYPFDPQDFGPTDDRAARALEHEESLKYNNAFTEVRRLPGNVGYLDFRGFSPDYSVGATIAAAMAFIANTDALIIDLRKNGGGDPTAAQSLESYFFDSQQQITSIEWRDDKTGKMEVTQQYTAPNPVGPLYLQKPVYVLTSSRTFSCAEQFTYDLHNLKRITIVGETTGGGANPGAPHAIGDHFGIFIPQGRAYSPVTKTNWEGTGIAPDVAVPATQALTKAYGLALDYVKGHDKNGDVQDEVKEAQGDLAKALTVQQ